MFRSEHPELQFHVTLSVLRPKPHLLNIGFCGSIDGNVSFVCRHKRKMQNFLPCKTSPQSRCDVSNGNGVIYEDLTNIRPRTLPNHCAPGQTAPSIEVNTQCSVCEKKSPLCLQTYH